MGEALTPEQELEAASKRVRGALPVGYFNSVFYSGGQHCDETGVGRATEVQHLCCHDLVSDSVPYVRDVEEPAICSYIMRVCVPSLCAAFASETVAVATGTSAAIKRRVPRPIALPDAQYESSEFPDSFYAAVWSKLLVEGGDEFESIAGGEIADGVGPVRLSGI